MIEKVQIHPEGPTFSRLVWGVMNWGKWGHRLSAKEMLRRIELAIERGVTTFDHADIYGDYTTEEEFGEALRQRPELRKKMEIVTKCGIRMLAPNRPGHRIKSYDTSA
ncbi:MAG: aldo/keto reductase, partial [Saprospiraceae bacterium]|nr:aldo/keto reductase [Saprospiraceae bacterium]